MLQDCTNSDRAPVVKTFQRRVQQNTSDITAPGAASHRQYGSKSATSETREATQGDQKPRSVAMNTPLGQCVASRDSGGAGCPGGLLKSLMNRRTSVILPSNKADNWTKDTANRRQNELLLAMRARLAQLAALWTEIDAFELTVEDPGSSPEPERSRRKRIGCRIGHCGGSAHLPEGRAQGSLLAGIAHLATGAAAADGPERAAGAVFPAAVGIWSGDTADDSARRHGAAGAAAASVSLAASPKSSGQAPGLESPDTSRDDLSRDQRDPPNLRATPASDSDWGALPALARSVQRLGISEGSPAATGSASSSAAASTAGSEDLTQLRGQQRKSRHSEFHQQPQQARGTLHQSRSLPAEQSPEAAQALQEPGTWTEPMVPLPSCSFSAGAASAAIGRRSCSYVTTMRHESAEPVHEDAYAADLAPAPSGQGGVDLQHGRSPCARALDARASLSASDTGEGDGVGERQVKPSPSTGKVVGEAMEEARMQVARAQRQRQQVLLELREDESVGHRISEQQQTDEDEQMQHQAQEVPELQRDEEQRQQRQEDDELQKRNEEDEKRQQQKEEDEEEERQLDFDGQGAPRLSQPAASGRANTGRGRHASCDVGASAPALTMPFSAAPLPHTGTESGSSAAGAGLRQPSLETTTSPTATHLYAPADAEVPEVASPALKPLQRLLQLCGQDPCLQPQQLPTMDDVISKLLDSMASAAAATGGGKGRGRGQKAGAAAASSKLPQVVKVGEGSYGEAWRLGGGGRGGGTAVGRCTVMKVVPIEGDIVFNGGAQRSAEEVLSEALMSGALSSLADGAPPGSSGRGEGGKGGEDRMASANWTAGFVRMHALAVCRGPYSANLVKEWEKWEKQHGSENEPVSELPPDQLYWIIAMEDSGTDLEKYVLESWDQLRSVLLQTAVSLAVAEAQLQFEHRDLHWGNVLVRPVEARPDHCAEEGCLVARLRGQQLRVTSCGIATTIIDFTNSRLEAPGGLLVFCDLRKDPAVFEGSAGDVQFDTYRWMRALVDDDWSASCPATNCLWLSYLAEELCKRFGGGGGRGGSGSGLRLSASHKRKLREFRKRAVEYDSCGDLVWDELFEGLLKYSDG